MQSETLGVPLTRSFASGSRNANRRASPALTTTLSPSVAISVSNEDWRYVIERETYF